MGVLWEREIRGRGKCVFVFNTMDLKPNFRGLAACVLFWG